jgi:hypothetical protein
MAEHIPFVEKYKDSRYTNPGDNIDPNKKQDIEDKAAKDWFKRKLEYMYSCYIRDDAYIPYSTVRDYRICRLYAQGRQPNTKYMERLTIQDKRSGIRKGWMNISWDILPILPKFRSIVLGRFEEVDYNTQAHAIDDVSSTLREDAKWTKLVQTKYAKNLAEFRKELGLGEDQQEQLPFVPKSMEEMDMLASMGFFRLAYEITMDKLLIATAQKANWNEIKRRVFEDAVDLGIIAVKDYTDPVTGKPMVRYVDPEYLIIRQTRMNDFSNVSEAAEITWYSIGDLRAYGLTDEELVKASRAYSGIFGNPYMTDIPGYPQDRNRYDYLKVAVLDAEFESFDTYFFESRMVGGNEIYFDLPFGAKKASSKKNKFGTRQYQKRYRCKWVIGTDIIFDYGLQYDQAYDQENKPRSSYSCYRIAEKSMISQCLTSADDIQLAVLKLRSAMAESKPAGVMIEFGSLKEIAMGGDKMDPFDILKLYRDRGDLIFKYALQSNGMPLQGGVPPISELRGGIGPYLDELMKILDWNINMIREITGINSVVDASAPAPNALVGTAQIAEQGTSNVLRPLLSGYRTIKQRAFMNLCQRWQLAGKFYPQSLPFVKEAGGTSIEILKVADDVYNAVFDVYVDMPIRDEDKMQLEQACLASMQAAKTGSVGITMADYIYIKELMSINNMRAAWVYLSYREEQMQKQRDATAAQMQQMNAQQAQQQEVMKKQLEFETAMALEKVRERNMKLEYYYKMQLEKVKQTGQLPDDLVGEVETIRQQDEQQAQAEAQAQQQQQMAAQQQQQQMQ